jgi:excisionase family DNA binding protein
MDASQGEPKTTTIDEAAKVLGIGRNQAYAAAKRGEIPIIRIGKRILVLREPLKRMLDGVADDLLR